MYPFKHYVTPRKIGNLNHAIVNPAATMIFAATAHGCAVLNIGGGAMAKVNQAQAFAHAPKLEAAPAAAFADPPQSLVFSHIKAQIAVSRAIADIDALKVRNKIVKGHPKGTVKVVFVQFTVPLHIRVARREEMQAGERDKSNGLSEKKRHATLSKLTAPTEGSCRSSHQPTRHGPKGCGA